MAGIADLLVQGAQQSAQNAGTEFTQAQKVGGELAHNIEQIQVQRAQIEQKKQDLQLEKFNKVGGWFEAAAKLPNGAAKKAFVNEFIPKGISALGLQDAVDPTALKMLTGDPTLAAYLTAKTQDGSLKLPELLSALKDPEQLARFMPDAQRFGDEQIFKDTVEGNLEQLGEAYKFSQSEEGKAQRAQTLAGSRAGQNNITNLAELRKEVTGHPVTKDTLAVQSGYDKVRSAFGGKPSPAGDISGVFAYMKMLDPASTVREGEQAQARNATGVPEQIRNLYNRAINGESLNAKQRKDFLNRAEQLYEIQYSKQMRVNDDFRNIARSLGLNDKNIFAGTGAALKAPPKHKGEGNGVLKLKPKQIEIYKSSSPEIQKQIRDRLIKDYGLTEEEILKALE